MLCHVCIWRYDVYAMSVYGGMLCMSCLYVAVRLLEFGLFREPRGGILCLSCLYVVVCCICHVGRWRYTVYVLYARRYLHEHQQQTPIQFNMYFLIASLWGVLMTGIFGVVFKFLAARHWGRTLLLRYPSFFSGGIVSHAGPTDAQMQAASFVTTLYGYGYAAGPGGHKALSSTAEYDRKVVVEVSGPEAGYVATPIIMVQCAVTLIEDRAMLPPTGGVYSTGAAFGNTKLVERLTDNGVTFRVVECEG